MKKLVISYWAIISALALALAYRWEQLGTGDPVVSGLLIVNIGLLVAAFFVVLFKVFSMVKKINPPTVLNLIYWIVSFGLFCVSIQSLSKSDSQCYGSGENLQCFTHYPESGLGVSIVLLWVIVWFTWQGFNKYASKVKK
ncbi:hypothetical protein RYT91_004436 [Salmonella enterica]|nr:hypothetical protein [Salmonella enterica]ELM2684156.1 hypothetical protein [Salmonella enterica]